MRVPPTVKTDYRSRVLGFSTRAEADEERKAWSDYHTRIIERGGVANLLIGGSKAA